MNPAEKARKLAEIDGGIARAAERRAELLAHDDMHTPWPDEPRPNSRERELALRTVCPDNRGDCSMAVLITSFAHALAAYRVELTAPATSSTERTTSP